jgi:hypothetical protein
VAPKPRMPRGLGAEGQKLWKGVTGEFDLSAEPHKRRILFDACKTADVIKRLDDVAAKQAVTVKALWAKRLSTPASPKPKGRQDNSPNC